MPDKKLRSRDRRAGILARAEEIDRLHKAVHETFANRHKREGGIEAWERAAAAFRQRSASFDGEMARVRSTAAMEADPALRPVYEQGLALQRKIEQARAAGRLVPAAWILNPFYRDYYRAQGWLTDAAEPVEAAL